LNAFQWSAKQSYNDIAGLIGSNTREVAAA
jgi:hypothetical protein